MGKFFLKKNFTPVVYIQNDQRVMGIILRYVCWGTYRPPPGSPAADRPTRRPPRFGSTKGGGGGPPPCNPENGCTPLGFTHWLAAVPVETRSSMFMPVMCMKERCTWPLYATAVLLFFPF